LVSHFKYYLKHLTIVFSFLFLNYKAIGQENLLNKNVTIQFNSFTIKKAIEQLQQRSNISFAYDPSIIPTQNINSKNFENQSIGSVLKYILSSTNLTYEVVSNSIVIKNVEPSFYTFHGVIYDKETGENLIGVKIQINDLTQFSNQYGYFSISLPPGEFVVKCSYLGYQTKSERLELKKDDYRSIGLNQTPLELKEVNISAPQMSNDSLELLKSVKSLSLKEVNKLPYYAGEIDIIKALQTETGVKNPSEGSSGLSVRGGNLDQNLFLVDEAPVYNPSHLFGLISILNIDAVKSVDFYQDYIPANFGGRLSSVIDTKLDEGSLTNYHVKGGVSLLSARMATEGPIIKNKSSFLLSVRRSLTDLYNNDFRYFNINARYYDFNFKSNYILNKKNRIYFSVYHGFDHLFSDNNYANDWTNTTSTLRLNHIYNPRLFFNLSAIYSNYSNNLSLSNSNSWITGVRDITFKGDFTFYKKPKNLIQFGGFGTRHHFKPGETTLNDINNSIKRSSALEFGAYFNQDIKLNDLLSLKYGLRVGSFNNAENLPQKAGYAKSTKYFNLEPRLQLSFTLSKNQFLRFTYTRNTQDLQLIQNNEQAYSSLETWLPAGKNIKPQQSDLFSSTYTYLKTNFSSLNLSAYYKKSYHQVDLLDHSQIILNPFFKDELRFGTGTAYGIELTIHHQIKAFSAKMSYSYSRTFRKIQEINSGIKYSTNYDSPNDLKLDFNYIVSPRFNISALFNYQTGRAVTLPVGFYTVNGAEVPIYEGRNNSRFPDFSRLDFSAELKPKFKQTEVNKKRVESTWVFGLYNVYSRRNPLFYKIGQNEPNRNIGFEESFSGILPTISYSFKF
jgi:hypothetical protein